MRNQEKKYRRRARRDGSRVPAGHEETPMTTLKTIDVQGFLNSHKLSPLQIWILAMCFLIVAVDGFDTAAIGFIAPAIRAEWGLTPGQLAPLFGAGLFGLMIGAFLFGPL